MLNPSTFRDLVSGRRRGAGASLLRGGLRLAEAGYAAAARLRNRFYDIGAFRAHRSAVPVVSVGNLTLGGAGKTPMVRWLARWFEQRGLRPAVISRGYGSAAGEANDEALEMRLLLPGMSHVQNPDRVTAVGEAVDRFGAQVAVLDDGFQHRRIARDLDIVLLDALAPFGFGHVFPRGMLREPLSGLRRAGVVVLARADLIEPAERESIWQVVRRHAPGAARVEASHSPQSLLSGNGEETSIESIRDKSAAAFCGIGNPDGFRRTLERCGCRVVGFREFPDHHRYTAEDLESLSRWAAELDASAVLCTCKDLVKIARERLGKPLWAVRIEMELLGGQAALESRLEKIVR